jgi:hypothetical protein
MPIAMQIHTKNGHQESERKNETSKAGMRKIANK